MTVYLLEIMAFGIVLFAFASLWDKRHAAHPDSAEPADYPEELDAIERAILARLVVKVKRAKPRTGFGKMTEESPKKATAK